jgi:hypothetical protein
MAQSPHEKITAAQLVKKLPWFMEHNELFTALSEELTVGPQNVAHH